MTAANPAAAVDASIASLFCIVHHWRRATAQHRWAVERRHP